MESAKREAGRMNKGSVIKAAVRANCFLKRPWRSCNSLLIYNVLTHWVFQNHKKNENQDFYSASWLQRELLHVFLNFQHLDRDVINIADCTRVSFNNQ